MTALRPVSTSIAVTPNPNQKFFKSTNSEIPGYFIQWTEREANILRLGGEMKADIVASVEVEKLHKEDFFTDSQAKNGWLRRLKSLTLFGSKRDLKIVQVIPRRFDFLVVVELGDAGFGFVLGTGESFEIADIAPLSGKKFKFTCADGDEELLFAVNEKDCFEYRKGAWKKVKISLNSAQFKLVGNQFIWTERALINIKTGEKLTLPFALEEDSQAFTSGNCLYLTDSKEGSLLQLDLDSGQLHFQRTAFKGGEGAFFGERQFLQFSPQNRSLHLSNFSLLPSDSLFFASGAVADSISCPFAGVADVFFSAAEVFILDTLGGVWAVDLPLEDEQVSVSYCSVEELEFAHIFDILGPFPLPSAQFYWQRRRDMYDGRLCFDFAVSAATSSVSPERFPPADWPALSAYCRDVFRSCGSVGEAAALVFYLLLCASSKDSTRQEIFCKEFALTAKQVFTIRFYWLIDHGALTEACALFLQNNSVFKPEMQILNKLIHLCSVQKTADFCKFSRFLLSNTISLDDFLQNQHSIEMLFRETLKVSTFLGIIDCIKSMFARMKPSDAAAQIPVPVLHMRVLTCVLQALLTVDEEATFLSRAVELSELPFEPEIVSNFMMHLQGDLENISDAQRQRILVKLLSKRQSEFSESAISLNSIKSGEPSIPSQQQQQTDPLARFFQKHSPSASPTRSPSTTASTPNRANLTLRPHSPLQLPRHFPPKQPTRLSQAAADDEATAVASESRPMSKRRNSVEKGVFVVDDEEVGEIAPIYTKNAPIEAPKKVIKATSNKRRRKT